MVKEYQAWRDDNSIALVLAEDVRQQFAQGLLSPAAQLIYKIEAHTHEEAATVHFLRMGFEPYIPMGEPRECPINAV